MLAGGGTCSADLIYRQVECSDINKNIPTNHVHFILAMFIPNVPIVTHLVMVCNSTCRFFLSSTEVGDTQKKVDKTTSQF